MANLLVVRGCSAALGTNRAPLGTCATLTARRSAVLLGGRAVRDW
jgi:hypothetical protein